MRQFIIFTIFICGLFYANLFAFTHKVEDFQKGCKNCGYLENLNKEE